VSNFGPKRLAAFMDDPEVTVPPAVNQVELHPYLPQHDLVALCRKRGVALVAYCPLGSPGNAALRAAPHLRSEEGEDGASVSPKEEGAAVSLSQSLLPMLIAHPSVLRVAQRIAKTPSQVLLRWNLDRGVAVIPKSTSAAHLADNVAVFGWSLGHKDKALIDSIGNEGTVRYVPVNRELLLHSSNEETFWD